MNVISGVDVTDFKFVEGGISGTVDCYEKDIVKPFALSDAKECYNLWDKEKYQNPILKKAFSLYATYTKRGSSILIGEGETIGYLAYITGKAYRGMGALGCSCRRTKGIGLVLEKGTKMETELSALGLYDGKKTRFKGLTASVYTLVTKVHTTVRATGNGVSRELEIGLQGDDGSYIDLTTNYTHCMTLDFK